MADARTFLKTTAAGKGRARHYHIAYVAKTEEQINPETQEPIPAQGTGITSVVRNHAHQVSYDAASDSWLVSIGEDGHQHDLEEIQLQEPETEKQTDDEIVADVTTLLAEGLEQEAKSREAADKSERYYRGEQWNEQLKRELESTKRAALTINLIQPSIKRLIGWQRQQRTEIRYAPVEDGDQRAADLYNILAKNALEQCFYDREESKVFEDITIPGRSAFNVFVDTENDLQGRVVVERFSGADVLFGPHEKEDGADMEWMIKHRLASKAKVKQLWPDKAEDVQRNYEAHAMRSSSSAPNTVYATDQYGKSLNTTPVNLMPGGLHLIDVARKEYRLIECWRKVYRRATVIVDPQTEFVFNAENWSRRDISQIKTIPGLRTIEKNVAKIRITRLAGTTLLDDENPAELPVDDFFTVPVYGNRRNGQWWGEVEVACDAQNEVNKRRSQSIDVVNRCAAYGWFYTENTFPSPKDEEQFNAEVSTPGFRCKISDINNPPRKEEGIKFPTEIVNMMEIAEQTVKELLAIQIENVGANTSGAAMLQAQRMGLLGHEHLFDNLAFAKKKLGRLLLHTIRAVYTPERAYRIVAHANSQANIDLAGQAFNDFTPEEIMQLFQNSDVAKLDVVVVEGENSPTEQIAIYLLLLEMMKSGQQIPPQLLFKLVPGLPDKYRQEMISTITQNQEQAAQNEQAKADSEIVKTLVAKGMIPPEVAQRFGVASNTPQPPSRGQITPNTESDLAGGGIQ